VPEYVFDLSRKQSKLGVFYCMIYDGRDESLGANFVKSKFHELGFLLQSMPMQLGPAVSWGDVSYLSQLRIKVEEFSKCYERDRAKLAGDSIFN